MHTFEITLQSRSGDRFPIAAEYAQTGYLTVRREGSFEFSDARREELRRLELSPKDYGTVIGGLVFQDDIRDMFMQARQGSEGNLRILLVVEAPELKPLRWERLCAPIRTGGKWDFLSLDQQSLYSLYLPSATDRRFPAIGRLDLKALVLVAAPPENNRYGLPPFNARAAVESIRSSLGEIPHDVLANTDGSIGPPTIDALCASITGQHYTLLHIVAHGWFNAKTGETVLYLLSPEGDVSPTPATRLIERLDKLQGARGLPHLTFLSTCESAIAGAEAAGALGGLAQRLVRDLGMPAVVAMTEKVSMKTADTLAANFYVRLREHGEADRALAQACAELAEAADATVPALYSRLGGRPLFSDTEDRPLTRLEIEEGLNRLQSLLPERAPILLPLFSQHAESLRAVQTDDESSLSRAARQERNLALDEINAICEKVLDINFRAVALGQNIPDYDQRCPFPGLLAFQPHDRQFYFGRESLVKHLTDRVSKERVLAVIGGSGSGKSSLVLAGIVPALQQKYPGIPVNYMTPGTGQWAFTVCHSSAPTENFQFCSPEALTVEAPETDTGIFIIDQFEELFTLCTEISKRKDFIRRLTAMSDKEPGNSPQDARFLIITMRADFWGECAAYPELKTIMQVHQELVGPMSLPELRSAMEQQAAKVGLRFEADLSHKILSEVENEPGAMPLLQHLLQELWRRRHGRWLRTSEYQAMGGIRQAISFTADELYASLSDADQNLMRNVFIRLTRLDKVDSDQEIRDTRRRVPFDDLIPAGEDPAVVRNIVKRLADARLVVTQVKEADVHPLKAEDQPEVFRASVTFVEVSHEALIRYWPRLRKWIDEDRSSLRLLADISEDAAAWDSSGRQSNLLPRWNARLEEAVILFRQPRFVQSRLESDFLEACIRLRDMEKAEKEAQEKREREALERLAAEQSQRAEERARLAATMKRRFVLAVIVGIVAIVAMISSMYQRRVAIENEKKATEAKLAAQTAEQAALKQERIALNQKRIAEKNEETAKENLVRMFEEKAGFALEHALRNEYPDHNFQIAWLFTLVALNQDIVKLPISIGRLQLPELRRGFYRQLWSSPIPCFGHTACFSADGRYIASGYANSIRLWEVQTGKLLKVFYGHSDRVNSVSFSPDQKRLASGSSDNTVRWWDVETGEEIKAFTLHFNAVRCVAFSPDGKRLASASDDHTIMIRNAETGDLLNTLSEHFRPVYSVAFSPNGKLLASASGDHTARLWDVETGINVKTFSGYSGEIYDVDFSPDGKLLAAGSGDYTIRIWNTESGKEIKNLSGHSDKVLSVNFSPDGRRLISGSPDHTVQFWDMEVQERIRTCSEYSGRVQRAIFSPDGKTVLSCSEDSMIRLRDAETGSEMTSFPGHTGKVFCVAFSPDGKWVASGAEDTLIQLWEVETGRNIMTFSLHSKGVRCLAFSPDGKRLASGSEDATIRVWDTENLELFPSLTLSGHTSDVVSLCFSPDGKRLVSGSIDKTVRIWDIPTGRELKTFSGSFISGLGATFSPNGKQVAFGTTDLHIFISDTMPRTNADTRKGSAETFISLSGHSDKILCLSYSPDGTLLASGSYDNSIGLWDVRAKKLLKSLLGHSGWITSLQFSSDGHTLISGSTDRTVRLWDVRIGNEIKVFFGHSGYINSVSLSPDGKRAASGSDDYSIRLWETELESGIQNPSVPRSPFLIRHSYWVSNAKFSPDEKHIAYGLFDNTVRIRELESGTELYALTGHTAPVLSVAYSSDGRYIVSSSADKTLRLWDAHTGKLLKVFSGHQLGVNTAVFRPDGRQLASASEDHTIRLWDVEAGREMAVLFGHLLDVQSVSYSPNGLWLASGSWDKTIRLWDVEAAKQVKIITGHPGDVLCVAFSPDGKLLASASSDMSIRIWDIEADKVLRVLSGHTDEIWYVAFSPDGEYVASASKDKTIRLWTARSGKILAILSGHTDTVFSIAFSSDGTQMVSASRDKTIRIWHRELIDPFLVFGRKSDFFAKLYKLSFELLDYRMDKLTLVTDYQRSYLPLPGVPASWKETPRPLGKDPAEWILEHATKTGN